MLVTMLTCKGSLGQSSDYQSFAIVTLERLEAECTSPQKTGSPGAVSPTEAVD